MKKLIKIKIYNFYLLELIIVNVPETIINTIPINERASKVSLKKRYPRIEAQINCKKKKGLMNLVNFPEI